MLACSQQTDATELTELSFRESSVQDSAGTFRLKVTDRASYGVRDGRRVVVLTATTNRNLSQAFSWYRDDPFGQTNLRGPRSLEIVLSDDEANIALSGMPFYVRMTPRAAGAKVVYARLALAPRFAHFQGDSAVWISEFVRPVYLRTNPDTALRYRGKVSTSTAATELKVRSDGNSLPTVSRVDAKHFVFDWPYADLAVAANPPHSTVDFHASLTHGDSMSKSAELQLAVAALDLTTDVPQQVWPLPTSCDDAVNQCLQITPNDARDYAACGDYLEVLRCVQANPPTTGMLSALFPPTSRYQRPFVMGWAPADTDWGGIEDDAHVVDYVTADGRNTAELWWTGGDGGTPILAYLVDEQGTFYLPELSQPREDADRPFETVQDAATRFAGLAEAHYRAAAAAMSYFGSKQFDTFASDSLPGGSRLDARPGQAARASIPEQVLAAFDFYYRVENADWGSVSLHQGTLSSHEVYALYTSTDGDHGWLEVFAKSGTPLVSARLWAGRLLGGWDEFFGRTRQSTGLESLWDLKHIEGYSEPEDRQAAGEIPLDWKPDVTIANGTLYYDSTQLTTLTLGDMQLSMGQRMLAYAAFEILWQRVLQFRTTPGQPLGLPAQGSLRLGTFVNPLDRRRTWVADWKDIDDASYTFYFEHKRDMLVPAIEQYNN
jgi:hypothetical protein